MSEQRNGHSNGKHAANGNTHPIDKRHAAEIVASWRDDQRWKSVLRPYSAEDVLRLRGSIQIEYTLARIGAQRLWELLYTDPIIAALAALTGNQAIHNVK